MKKKVALDINGLLQKLNTSIERMEYRDVITLLYRIPPTLNDVLNEEYFDALLYRVTHLETGILVTDGWSTVGGDHEDTVEQLMTFHINHARFTLRPAGRTIKKPPGASGSRGI